MAKETKEEAYITIFIEPLEFYSNLDEDMMFRWLKKMKFIKSIEGYKNGIYVTFETRKLSGIELNNLMGLFLRYHFNPKLLEPLIDDSNYEWYKDKMGIKK